MLGEFDEVEAHAAHAEIARRAHDDILHRHRRYDTLIESMSAEQIIIFAELIDNFCHDGASLFYYKGVVAKVMTAKHGICPCGRDHADDLLREVTVPIPAAPVNTEPEIETTPVVPVEPIAFSYAGIDQLIKYNMKYVGDGLFCKNCGIKYVSMADRMLKPPDDCHGCEVKSKWG